MQNFKWSVESFNDSPIYVVLFVSRKKDNQNIEGFIERRESFITHDIGSPTIGKFKEFVDRGLKGETSRMYVSVNERDGEKIHKALIHFLFDNPDFNLCSILPKLAGLAAQKECAKTKRWMFDFDINDINKVTEFLNDISTIDNTIITKVYKTPNGYAIVADRGFDCRTLMEKWGKDVTLKRDDLLCIMWKTKGDK